MGSEEIMVSQLLLESSPVVFNKLVTGLFVMTLLKL
jgi:hypothetical protein